MGFLTLVSGVNNLKTGKDSKYLNSFLESIGSSREKIEKELTELFGVEEASSILEGMKKRLAVVSVRDLLAKPFVDLINKEGSELLLGLKAVSTFEFDLNNLREKLESEGVNPLESKEYRQSLKIFNDYLKSISDLRDKIYSRKYKEKELELEDKKISLNLPKPKIININLDERSENGEV